MTASASRTARAAAQDLRDTVRVGDLEIDRAPVTNRRYATFVAVTGHRPPTFWPRGECPRERLDHPVTGVDFFDAIAFALWSGGSIPTEEEWIAAAGLTEPSVYVWGDQFDTKRCNTKKSGIRGTTPVGAYEGGKAPSGCVDLCGNVWEMTCTAFPLDSDSILVKGGSWADLPAHARLDTQFRTRVNKASGTVGFRLVYGVPGFLPHFLDRDLVDQCIAFRKADAPHFDAGGDEGEFEAIVDALRKSAGPHLARLQAQQRAALVGSGTAAPAPAAPHLPARLGAALREIGSAAAVRKIVPVLRVFLQPGGRRPFGRFRNAWAEAHRPRRGAPLRQALGGALVALFPERGRGLYRETSRVVGRLVRLAASAVRGGLAKVKRKSEPAPAAPCRVRVRGTPPPRVVVPMTQPLVTKRILKNPRRLFVLLCIFAGAVLGLLGTMMRDGGQGSERARVETRSVAEAEPQATPPAPAPPIASPAPAPVKQAAPEAEPDLPSTTRALSGTDVRVVLERLKNPRPQERDEAERFLVWHRAETADLVRAALRTEKDPVMLSGLAYVAAAIEEMQATRPGVPTVVSSPPQQGLLLVCESLDAAEDIAMVRRTARAARLEATVVYRAEGNAGALAKTYGDILGDVRLYVDQDGAFSTGLRLERIPAVVAMRNGKPVAIAYGRVQRSRLADLAAKLR
jgi:hypothetical protein